ncbi:MAG: flagellar basal body L-ring protein FlgH [Burkholderiales bacterium]|nr:flagellar basal body L-ring protein FlgH [Burkholderiales bacterium]
MGGCYLHEGRVPVREPTSAPPAPARALPPANGAIYQSSAFRPLFEDRRARHVGDLLTVLINEKQSASRSASSSVERKDETKAGVPTIAKLPLKALQGITVDGSGSSSFEGKGDTAADDAFTGTITVTVIEQLANGNLVVSGEKQIGINRNSQTIRLSGVVNPTTILAGNTVSSTQIADARIDYRGSGAIDDAQVMGWLARFFLTVLPF